MITLVKGDILDNWCAGNNEMILLIGHSDLLKGRYYLNNEAVARVKNFIPDFNDFMNDQITSAIKANGPEYPYTILQYNEKLEDGEIIQRLGFYFTRQKWDQQPTPDFVKIALDQIFIRIGLHKLYDKPVKPIMIQDPITSDIEMTEKAVEAIKRLYSLYPPEIELWTPDDKSA